MPLLQQQYPLAAVSRHVFKSTHAACARFGTAIIASAILVIIFAFIVLPPVVFRTKKPPSYLVVRRLITILWIVCLFSIFATLLTVWFRSYIFVVIKNAHARTWNLFRRTKRVIRPHHGNTPWRCDYKRIFSDLQLFRAGRFIKTDPLQSAFYLVHLDR